MNSGVANPDRWFVEWMGGGDKSKAGVKVTAMTAMNLSAVWQAVNVISGDVAQLPLPLYKRVGDKNKEVAREHPSFRLIKCEPNNRMSWATFAQTLTAQALLLGNGYGVIARNARGEATAIHPLMADRTEPFIDRGRLWYKTEVGPDRDKKANPPEVRVISPSNIIHIKGLGWDGLGGLSVVQLARDSFGLGIAAQDHGGRYFGKYATPQGILTMPGGSPGEKASKEIRDNWKRLQSDDNEHDIAVLFGGATFTPISMANKDSQWLESRAFQRNEVASWFNLPPHKVGDLERATFSNIYEQNLQYLTTSLMHWLTTWEKELNAKLLTKQQREQDTHFFEFITDAFLRGDPVQRTESLKTQFLHGKLTINEWRAKDNENGIGPEGDVHFVPLNMTTLERAIEGEPEETPEETPEDKNDDESGEGAADNEDNAAAASGDETDNAASDSTTSQGDAKDKMRAMMVGVLSALLRHEKNAVHNHAKQSKNFLNDVDRYYNSYAKKLTENVKALGGDEAIVTMYVVMRRELLLEVAGKSLIGNLADNVEMAMSDWPDRVEGLVNLILESEAENVAA
jgi:HK97 family phage portal protein